MLSNHDAALSPRRPETMPYATVITGAEHVLEDLAPSFSSAIAKIRRREGEWILESSRFEPYESDEKLYEAAKALVSQIHEVLALYLRLLDEPLTVRALLKLTDDDKLVARRRYSTMTVNVYMPARRAFIPTDSGSLGTVVLSRAATDPAITEALSLVGHQALTWGRIYDILEFVRVKRSIVKRTANHYRHLGNPNNYPLPPNAPTLAEASLFATDLLKTWIAKRI
jgi:hypothetical protein